MAVAELDRSLEKAVKRLILAVWRTKILFLLTSSIVFGLILLSTLAIQPLYEGSTLLIGGQVNLEQLPNGTRRPAESSGSLSRIAESEEVVSAAIQKVGLQTLVQNLDPNTTSLFARLRGMVFPAAGPRQELSPIDAFLPQIKMGLSVRAELTSDTIRIAFRHRDPAVAAAMANAVAQAFIDRQIALYSRPGAADFFQRQKGRFDDEFKRASDSLEKFSIATATYSANEQRQLLLKRLNDLALALAITRGSVSEKAGQRQALAEQLRRLAPVARSTYVSSLVEFLGTDRNAPAPRTTGSPAIDDRTSDPPLLLVKVYQDSMVTLFKINSDLAGAQNLQTQQLDEMSKLTTELNRLSQNEQEFTRLKRAVDQAAFNLDTYSKRMVEEQINAESSAAKFSSIKVLQAATPPLRPVFPNYILAVVTALLASALAGVGMSLALSRHR